MLIDLHQPQAGSILIRSIPQVPDFLFIYCYAVNEKLPPARAAVYSPIKGYVDLASVSPGLDQLSICLLIKGGS